jgi:hypothetical protein
VVVTGTGRATLCRWAGLSLIWFLGNTAARGQSPGRQGFSVEAGGGYGWANASCENCLSGPTVGGITAFITIDQMLSSFLGVGATIEAWFHSDAQSTEMITTLAATLRCYPLASTSPLQGLFIVGGVGVSGYRTSTSPSVSGTGPGFMMGAGYSLHVSRRVSLTPQGAYTFGKVGDLEISGSGRLASGWRQQVYRFGLGIRLRL